MRRLRSGTLFVPPLLFGLAVAGCGANPDTPQVATAGGVAAGASPSASASVSDEDRQREFVKCMRENGVDLPDPEPGQRGMKIQIGAGIDKEKVQPAMEKCRSLLPNGGERPKLTSEQVEKLRELARCMRENGVPDFPDPGADGSLQLNGVFKMDDPTIKAAMEKCRPEGVPVMIRGGAG
ncbi:hypothetical protein ONA70_03355 [Micromonospora yasonensis]|uniref:hypothetical protein n=1 Tax=Micromonospora yasonensis TaxID=1128667 RepID=UPI00222EEDDF|nr:hypothetical protein [Micromonospora yasonensis]MCW3839133.1 hypothetical protein [Micromonospora yasonensis]